MPAYILRAGNDGPVKIGHASIVAGRVKALQTGQHEELTVLRVIEGDGDVEGAFHENFKSERIRGEWFNFVPAMLEFEPGQVWATAGRRARSVAFGPANAAFAEMMRDISIVEMARAADVTPRTAENWKSGRTGPDWRSVAAMLRDENMRPLILQAALKAALVSEGK